MKRLIFALIILSGCSKTEESTYCQQCKQVTTDSISGTYIKTEYGSPNAEAMRYCNGALKQAKSNYPYYRHSLIKIHNTGIPRVDYSTTQKVELICK